MKTIEEVNQEMLNLKVNELSKVKFVPFGEIEYKLGYISKVTVDKRTNTILYLIVTDEGKKVYKTPNAKYLEILDEKVQVASKVSIDMLKAENAKLLKDYEDLYKRYEDLENEVNVLREKLKKYIK